MINIEKVSKIYNKHRRNQNIVLHETSLELPDEGFVFFIGQSGTGKSTMLNAIGGLISYEGQILFDKNQVDIEQYRKRNIGYIFQNFLIFEEMSVYENIQVALNLIGIYDQEEIHKRTRTLLSAVELDINPNRRAGALSLGQRQRVAIARALASNPKIILADEPTGNLDSKNSIIIMNILKKLSKNHLVICVTHNLGLVNKYADETFKIDEKKLIGFDKNASKEITSSNVTQNINVANMSVNEYKDEDFLIKLYTQDSDKKDENNQIKIVRQNGRILVIGNNISIATKEEIQLESKKENAKNIISSKEEEKVDLNFEERKDKKTFSDTGFSRVIHKKIYGKHNFKTFLLGASNVVFPIIIFVLFNLMISQVNSLADTNLAPLHEDYIYLASEDNQDKDAVTTDIVSELCNDPESGIVDVVGAYPYGLTAETSINTSNNFSISDFSFADDIISPTVSFSDTYINYDTKDIADYAIFDEFIDVDADLDDNEIYITSAIENQISSALGSNNVAFANQKTLAEELKTSSLDFEYKNWDNSIVTDSYTIKDIIESDLPYVFANNKTYLHFNLFEPNNFNNYVHYYYEGVLENFDFVEYDDIKDDNSRYEVFISDEDESVLSDYSIFPLCYLSQNADVENTIMPYFPIMESYIVDKENPDAKVVCFKDYYIGDTKVDSSALFLSKYVNMTVISGEIITAPEGLKLSSGTLPDKIGEVLLPNSYTSFGLSEYADVITDYFDYTITGYYDDSKTDFKSVICSSSQIESIFFPEFISTYQNNLADLLTGSNNALLTTDIEKTKTYLANHPELKLTSYSYDSIFSEFNPNPLASTILSFAIAIAVIGGIFVGIIIISNFGGVNKDKYKFGVLRCLGYSKMDLFKENSSTILADGIFNVIIPCLLFTILMLCFNVYNLGFLWTLVFYAAYILVLLVSSNIPLLFLLRRKPVDIIGSLN